jgi:hypothetical protein
MVLFTFSQLLRMPRILQEETKNIWAMVRLGYPIPDMDVLQTMPDLHIFNIPSTFLPSLHSILFPSPSFPPFFPSLFKTMMTLLTLFAHVEVFRNAHILKQSCQAYFHSNCIEGDSSQV